MSPLEAICLEGNVRDRKEQKLERDVEPRRESTEGPRRQDAAFGGASWIFGRDFPKRPGRAFVVSHELVPSRNGRARRLRCRRLQRVYEVKTRRA